MKVARRSIKDALEIGHELSLCISLAVGMCPIALAVGDLEEADRSITMLIDHSTRHALAYWQTWSYALRGVLLIKRGDIHSGVQILSTALAEEMPAANFAPRYIAFLGEFADALDRSGETRRALATIDWALDRCQRWDGRWCFAELLRIKGEVTRRQDVTNAAAEAEKYFLQSLDLARRQGTRSWELRTATSFARLLRDQDRDGEARDLLKAAYAKFTEGFETADLKTAKSILDDLA
jgi:predicted ATPase